MGRTFSWVLHHFCLCLCVLFCMFPSTMDGREDRLDDRPALQAPLILRKQTGVSNVWFFDLFLFFLSLFVVILSSHKTRIRLFISFCRVARLCRDGNVPCRCILFFFLFFFLTSLNSIFNMQKPYQVTVLQFSYRYRTCMQQTDIAGPFNLTQGCYDITQRGVIA